jgi:hypothetical protein
VVGLAFHATGITDVLIDGEPASWREEEDGRVKFLAYVPVAAETREVEVAVYSHGPPMVRHYEVEPTLAPMAYPQAETAWSDVGGGFDGRRYAVVVGVSSYEDQRIPSLLYADRDAVAFHDFLLSERAGLGGFQEEDVVLLLNEEATYRDIRTALFTFLMRATEDDVVILYFAGHGSPDPFRPEEHYLLSYDSESDNLAGTAFPMEDVGEAVRRLRSRDVIVITDACHSAAVGGQVGRRAGSLNAINRSFLTQLQSSTGGYVTITASEVSQFSHEDDRWGGGHGIFTYYLLDALNGAADEDGDRIVTLGEMFEYVRDRVQRETLNAQVPTVSQTPWDRAWPMAIVLEGVEPAGALPPADEWTPPSRPVAEEPAWQPAEEERPEGAEPPSEEDAETIGLQESRSGFWMRMGFGAGAADFKADEMTISGTAGQFSFSLGGFVSERWVVFGQVDADIVSGPTLEVGGLSVVADDSTTASQVGFGVGTAYYFGESNALVGFSILFPRIQLESSEGLVGDTELGSGASLFLGKEWAISRAFTLGGAFRVGIGNMKDQGDESEWKTTAVGGQFTVTWAPKGVGWRR